MNTKRKTAPKSAFVLKVVLILLAIWCCSGLLLPDFAGQLIETAPVAAQDVECYEGLVVDQGERCTYPGTSSDFSVDSSGRGRFLFASSLVIIAIANSNINGVVYTFVASAGDDGSWVVDAIGSASSAAPTPTATRTTAPPATPTPTPTSVATATATAAQILVASSTVPASPSPAPTPTSAPEATPTPTVATVNPTASSQQAGVPASPANIRAVWEGSSVRVSWNASANATHYKVYHDDFFSSSCRISSFGNVFGCEELSSSVSGTTHLHASPDDRRNYYWVTACNAEGCSEIDRYNAVQPGDSSQAASPTPTTIPTQDAISALTPLATPTSVPEVVPTPTPAIATPAPTASSEQAGVPASPANVRAVWEGSSVRVSWDGVSGATSYKVYHDDFRSSNCRISFFGTLFGCDELSSSVSGTTYLHTSPDDRRNYYWVTACNAEGCSEIDRYNAVQPGDSPQAASPTPTTIPTQAAIPTPALATPTPVPAAVSTPTVSSEQAGVPASPANVRAVWEGSSLRVSWDEVSGATSYKVYHDDFRSSNCRISFFGTLFGCDELSSSVSGTTYLHTSPDDRRNYYWVTACNAEGCSEIDRYNAVQPGDSPQAASPTPTTIPTPTPTPAPTPTPMATQVPVATPTETSAALATATPIAAATPAPTPLAQQQAGWPAPPTGVRAVYSRGGSEAKVNWDRVEGADYYQVYLSYWADCREPGNYLCPEVGARVTGTSHVDTWDALTGTGEVTHHYVRACNSDGCSSLVGAPTLMPMTPTPTPVPTLTSVPATPTPTATAVAGQPDLVIDALTVSDSALTVSEEFSLNAVIRNQGSGPANFAWISFYRSTDDSTTTVSDDTSENSYATRSSWNDWDDWTHELGPSGSRSAPTEARAPPMSGIYYYYACVDGPYRPYESDTTNNCSDTVTVTVVAPAPTPTPPHLFPPHDVRAAFVGPGRVEISWTAVSAADSYYVYHNYFNNILGSSSLGTVQAGGAERISFVHTAPRPDSNYYFIRACTDALQVQGPSACVLARPVWVGRSTTQRPTAVPTPGFLWPRPTPTPVPGLQPYLNVPETEAEAWRRYYNLRDAWETGNKWGPYTDCGINSVRPCPHQDRLRWWLSLPYEAQSCAAHGICP